MSANDPIPIAMLEDIEILMVQNGYIVRPAGYGSQGRYVANNEIFVFPTVKALAAWIEEALPRPKVRS